MRASLMCPSRSTPYDDCLEPSALEDAVLLLLEAAGIPTTVNDQIMKLIAAAEAELHAEPPDDEQAMPTS